jgi:hypothetical protein
MRAYAGVKIGAMQAEGSVHAVRMNPLGAVAFSAVGWLAVFGGALAWALQADLVETVGCMVPAVLVTALGFTAQADRRQYVARLLAGTMFGAIGLLMWAASHDNAGLWLLAFVAALVAAFLGWIVWLAQFTTRIAPAAGVTACAGAELARRLGSLRLPAWHIGVHDGRTSNQWRVEAVSGGEDKRLHRIDLAIDGQRREVRVREYLGAGGAAPRDAAERSMRAVGDPYFDPTRPDAQAGWSRTWQSTMVVPEVLASTHVELARDRAVPAQDWASGSDDAVVTLFAAVVTRSGYAWRPRLFGASAQQ